jgi:NAD binding domain of 6-phosphogluconate dehydrogenase
MRSSRRYERHLPGYPSGVSKPSKPLERCAEVRTPPNRGPSGETARLGGSRTGRALRARTPASAWHGKTRPTGFASRRKRTNMRVGFIGLGMIGSCMAANLQKAGHQLIVHDLSGTAAEPFLAKREVWSNSPREVGAQTEIVFTSLPVPADVKQVALGSNGVIERMRPDTAFSTGRPIRRWCARSTPPSPRRTSTWSIRRSAVASRSRAIPPRSPSIAE